MKITRVLLTITLAFMISVMTMGCNTMQGAGEDIESAGEEIQDAAE